MQERGIYPHFPFEERRDRAFWHTYLRSLAILAWDHPIPVAAVNLLIKHYGLHRIEKISTRYSWSFERLREAAQIPFYQFSALLIGAIAHLKVSDLQKFHPDQSFSELKAEEKERILRYFRPPIIEELASKWLGQHPFIRYSSAFREDLSFLRSSNLFDKTEIPTAHLRYFAQTLGYFSRERSTVVPLYLRHHPTQYWVISDIIESTQQRILLVRALYTQDREFKHLIFQSLRDVHDQSFEARAWQHFLPHFSEGPISQWILHAYQYGAGMSTRFAQQMLASIPTQIKTVSLHLWDPPALSPADNHQFIMTARKNFIPIDIHLHQTEEQNLIGPEKILLGAGRDNGVICRHLHEYRLGNEMPPFLTQAKSKATASYLPLYQYSSDHSNPTGIAAAYGSDRFDRAIYGPF